MCSTVQQFYCGTIMVDETVRVDRLGGRPYLIVRYLRIPPKFWGPRISVLFCLLSSSRDKGTHPPLVLTPLQYQQNLTWESVSNKTSSYLFFRVSRGPTALGVYTSEVGYTAYRPQQLRTAVGPQRFTLTELSLTHI